MNHFVSLLLFFFTRIKQHRAINRYGGHATTAYQELQPFAIEDDDSDTEEQALFDLQKARSTQAVL